MNVKQIIVTALLDIELTNNQIKWCEQFLAAPGNKRNKVGKLCFDEAVWLIKYLIDHHRGVRPQTDFFKRLISKFNQLIKLKPSDFKQDLEYRLTNRTKHIPDGARSGVIKRGLNKLIK
jgi:hypothetical protein